MASLNIDKLKAIDDYAALKITSAQFYKILGADVDFMTKYRTRINAAKDLRANAIRKRDLEVFYISGGSGSGKTTAAKYFAERLDFDPFVSGSGDDILDGYDKQRCIILDDFRGGSMRFMELLKMLDNHTNSSVKSRYNNKDISACRLIIITSVYEPQTLYNSLKEEGAPKEPIEQLFRRLKHHFYKIEDDYINEYTLIVGEDSTYTGKSIGQMSKIYKEMGIDPGRVDNNSLLKAFEFEREKPPKIEELTKEEQKEIEDIF